MKYGGVPEVGINFYKMVDESIREQRRQKRKKKTYLKEKRSV